MALNLIENSLNQTNVQAVVSIVGQGHAIGMNSSLIAVAISIANSESNLGINLTSSTDASGIFHYQDRTWLEKWEKLEDREIELGVTLPYDRTMTASESRNEQVQQTIVMLSDILIWNDGYPDRLNRLFLPKNGSVG